MYVRLLGFTTAFGLAIYVDIPRGPSTEYLGEHIVSISIHTKKTVRGSQILFSTLFHRSSQECLSTRHNSVATRTDDAVACTPYGVLRMEYNTKWLVQAREGYSYIHGIVSVHRQIHTAGRTLFPSNGPCSSFLACF